MREECKGDGKERRAMRRKGQGRGRDVQGKGVAMLAPPRALSFTLVPSRSNDVTIPCINPFCYIDS